MARFKKATCYPHGRPVAGPGRGGEPCRWCADPESRQGARYAQLRRQSGSAGLLQHGRQERVDRLRRRYLPRRGGGDFRRSREGDVLAARCGHPLFGAAVEPDRRVVAQLDMDDVTGKFARPDVRRRRLLRRPGLFCCAGMPGSTPPCSLAARRFAPRPAPPPN